MIWSPVHSASYLLIFLLAIHDGSLVRWKISNRCRLKALKFVFEYEYYQDGDIIIGGLFSAHNRVKAAVSDACPYLKCLCYEVNIKEYKNILALIFVINVLNKPPFNLPNITLGYHIFGTCGDPKKTLEYALKILSGKNREAPNYSCRGHREVVGFIGDSSLPTTKTLAQLLSVYGYTQINHQVTDILLSDSKSYPTLFHMSQDDRFRYEVIIESLLYFGWNWVIMVTPGDLNSDMELEEISKMMSRHEICIEHVIKFRDQDFDKALSVLKNSIANVVILCGLFSTNYLHFLFKLRQLKNDATLIAHESWIELQYPKIDFLSIFNSSLIFMSPSEEYPGLQSFINGVSLHTSPNDPVLQDIELTMHHCLTTSNLKNAVFQYIYQFSGVNCSTVNRGWAEFTDMKQEIHSYVLDAALVLRKALKMMYMMESKSKKFGSKLMRKLHRYVRNSGKRFNERGTVPSVLLLNQWVFLKREVHYIVQWYLIAKVRHDINENTNYSENYIYWNKAFCSVLRNLNSRCNEKCLPGYRKAPTESIHVCCYNCVPCPEGEVSNVTDSKSCFKCHAEEWPDEKKVKCILKTYTYLFKENDKMVLSFALATSIFSAITLFVIKSFINHRDSPVVKANNRTLSLILLTSILLSFLCVFLFFGHPVDITCILRQFSFVIFISVAVSSVLAKTTIIYITFKATKPGGSWKKRGTIKLSNSLVLTCSSVQILICVVWLSLSPPYQEYDMHSYPRIIFIECNKGTVIGFYTALSYMGFLATVCFVLAFTLRELPDCFYEAKYITFSMILFCTVWVFTIIAYLNTKGKFMVAVQIIAILSSSAGILGFLFFPKCYIIIFKPKLNTIKSKHIIKSKAIRINNH